MNVQQSNNARNGDGRSSLSNATLDAPADRGRLLFTEDVRRELLGGRKSASWVRHHFAPADKHKLGRDNFWYEADAYAWLASLKEAV